MPNPSFPSRRDLLGVAGAAAIGLAVGDMATGSPTSASASSASSALPGTILLRSSLSDDRLKELRALSTQLTIARDIPLADATVIFGNVNADELSKAVKLQWVQCPSAGVEHYPLEAMNERQIVLTNGQGCYAPEIAEHAFGLLFALTRGIATHARQNKWGYDG